VKKEVWKPKFIEALRESANVRAACQACGITRDAAYKARKKSPVFAAQWDEAIDEAVDTLEEAAWGRARDGVQREDPIFYQGEQVGSKIIREYSDTVLLALLKAHRPNLYRDPVHYNIDFDKLTDEQLDRLAAGEHPAAVLGNRRAGSKEKASEKSDSYIH
jgi:hypothetical protein